MGKVKNILIMMACLGLTTSCDKPNVLQDLSSTNSDEALYIDAQKDIDNQSWDAAINIIENQLSVSYQARRDVMNSHASAYAGKCGVLVANLVTNLQNASGSASQIFPYVLSLFNGVTVDPASCERAITIMQSIGAVGSRTADENLFLGILGLARISTNLGYEIDTDHNGTIDSSSNVCHEWDSGVAQGTWTAADAPMDTLAPAPAMPSHYLLDADIQKVVAGVGLIVENITALTNVIGAGNSMLTAVSSITSSCTTLGISCTTTDPTAVTAKMIYGFRLLLDTSAMGFGTCDISTPPPSAPTYSLTGVCCPSHKPPP
ncbi:MAG TPA: hypothetical protein VF412_01950 [Bdellovibrio sp.]|uniref:hypothetical protein n=1 Tax=Bdellovibrio sp. TaxID=28201 RepID=UPI002EEA4D15